jgi:4a-hydroxytetrahydrobiopterin dehydratase
MNLTERKCAPCESGVGRLGADEVARTAQDLGGWQVLDGSTRLHKRYRFADFAEAMRFVNAMADLAESENHHPDFAVHYRDVDVTLWTHAVGGLSMNDFILAAKLDAGLAGRLRKKEP